MARLRFPGRPGSRFDRIGVRYSAEEARQTTDPTLAIIANVHKGLQRFRSIFGDSDEEDTEFHGFTPAEVRAAERSLQQAIRQEKQLLEQQGQNQKYRYERSRATLANLAAAGIEFSKQTRNVPVNVKKTFKKIVDTGLVVDNSSKLKLRSHNQVQEVADSSGKQNGPPVPVEVPNIKRIRLKRQTRNANISSAFHKPAGKPKKFNAFLDGASDYQKATSFESIAAVSSVFGSKPVSKYTSVAKQILARATKQAAQTSNKLLTSKHKVRKFVLPTKSSRSSRVIKPNKRFLEDDSVHQLVAKQPKLSPTSPTSISAFKTPIFGMGVSSDKQNSFSAFQSRGLSLSPFNVNREKGFPAFSSAPQPSGTSSFMDGLANQKPLGSLDQPLIVEGKRPRKPSLIMRMKLVEDDPADEIRLQQQMSDISTPVRPSSNLDGQRLPGEAKSSLPTSSQTKCFGATKSLIAPAKLFTDSSVTSLSSKSFKSHHKHQQIFPSAPSQGTIVLRKAKLQLNRTALNRSKAALARSLKAQLKREAKLERRKRTSQNRLGRLSVMAPSAVSPRSSLGQLSPFSKLASDSAIERQKSGLFEGIEAGAGSFSPGGFGGSPVTASSLPALNKQDIDRSDNYQASLIQTESLLKDYVPGSKWRCLVCCTLCVIKKNRKLPLVPLCKSCKKSYFFQLITKSASRKRCKCGGRCSIHYSQKSQHHCVPCKFNKFEAVLNKCRQLGLNANKVPKEEKKEALLTHQQQRIRNRSGGDVAAAASTPETKKQADGFEVIKEEQFSTSKKQRHRSEDMNTPDGRRNRHKRGEPNTAIPTRQRQKHRSGDKIPELPLLRLKSPSHNKELINAANLDKPLSVDVGDDADPFSLSPPQTLSSTKSSPDKGLKSPSKKFGLTSNGGDKMSENDNDGEDDNAEAVRSRGASRGPRIKHVCRRAAMVFPQQRATFPEEPQKRTLTLSALPNEEKQQLWAKNKQEMARDSSAEESGDDQLLSKAPQAASPDKKLLSPKDEKQVDFKRERKSGPNSDKKVAVSRGEEKMDEGREGKATRNRAAANEEKDVAPLTQRVKRKITPSQARAKELGLNTRRRGYTRKIRCRECKGCKTPECGVCVFCRDKPKFGGPGRIKKCCIHSVCLAPKIPRKATQAFIEPKSPTKTNRRDDDDQNGDHHTRNQNSGAGFRESSSRCQEKRTNNHWRMDGNNDGAQDGGEDGVSHNGGTGEDKGDTSSSSVQNGLDMDGSRHHLASGAKAVRYAKGKYSPAVEATIHLALTDVRNPFMGRMSSFKRKNMISVPQKQALVELKPVQNQTAYSFDVPLKTHLIRADYDEDYDVETAWSHGFSLTVTGPSCIRALCFLCGSAGKHEMLYCLVCCQPYHSFCLDEDDRPEHTGNEEEGDDGCDDHHPHHPGGGSSSNTISWCCRRCQFCHVCGQQNGLLKCHRCKDTYHPECLGPNYPTRPSRKNIWVCTKCVRCKSCGATTPGVGTNATWTYDFSLCYECGKLMDKGNFCPICHKCYSDDDWESKMVQCAVCESWVHAKCEELTDEMYQLVSFLPEEVQYTCRVCSTEKPPYWEQVLKSELVNGLLNVLSALMGSKCAQMLLELGPPKETKKIKQSKGKSQDEGSKIDTASSKDLNSSTDSCDSGEINGYETSVYDTGQALNEQFMPASERLLVQNSVSNSEVSGSHHPKHVFIRRDGEIVEKCDCDTGQSQTDSQAAALNGISFGKNQMLNKFPNSDGSNTCSIYGSEKQHEGHSSQKITNTSGEDFNEVFKSDLRKAFSGCATVSATDKQCGLKNSVNDSEVMDLLLDLVNKDLNRGIFDNHKISAAGKINKLPGCSNHVEQNKPGFDKSEASKTKAAVKIPTGSSSASSVQESSLASLPDSSSSYVEKDMCLNLNSLEESPHSLDKEAVFVSRPQHCISGSSNGGGCLSDVDTIVTENTRSDILKLNVNGSTLNVVDKVQRCHQAGSSVSTSLVVTSVSSSLTTSTVISVQQEASENVPAWNMFQTPVKNLTGLSGPDASGLHVSFGHTVQENPLQSGEFPHDFQSIKLKIDSGSYTTVEEFSEDMVRIIQSLLFENELYTTRKKQANSVRSIFIKQMERCFPWFNVNTCKLWEHNRGLPPGMLKDAVLPPSNDHTYAQWLERKTSPMSPQPSPFKRVGTTPPRQICNSEGESLDLFRAAESQHSLMQSEDTRACLLCQKLGDDEPDHAGRLLYCGQDDWIHINCSLWSAEVFEEDDGSLQNVLDAVSRGKKLRCNLCQQPGATVGCCEANCRANYHFMCARADQCVFQENKTIYCKLHADCVNMNVVRNGHFGITNRICVNLNKIRAKSSWGKAVDPAILNIIIGSCTVESLGVLKSFLSDTEEGLYPVDFRCTRIYWSTQDARRRCVYTCRVVEVRPEAHSPGIHIHDMRVIHDEKHPEFVPLDQLNLESLGVPNFMKQSIKICSQVVDICDEMDDVIYTGSELLPTAIASRHSLQSTQHSSNQAGSIISSRSRSFQTTQNQILFSQDPEHCFIVDENDPHGVTKAWLGTQQKEKPKAPEPKPIDLTGLSPSTLALLNIKDPSRYIPPAPRLDTENCNADRTSEANCLETEELGLLKIADRLNNAASGRSRQSSTDSADRSLLKSPSLPLFSPVQHQQSIFIRQTDFVRQSLPSSPVSFRHRIRARSISEERPGSILPFLPSPGGRSSHFPGSSSPLGTKDHHFRARSESPCTVIKHRDVTPFSLRAISLSPPLFAARKSLHTPIPLPPTNQLIHPGSDEISSPRVPKSGSVSPIIEASDDEDTMVIEDAKKKSFLDSCCQFENIERTRNRVRRPSSVTPETGGRADQVQDDLDSSGQDLDVSADLNSNDISMESITSILESVPAEVLEGNDLKVVVLTDTEDLSEEDLMSLASAVMQDSSNGQGVGSLVVPDDAETSDGKDQGGDGQQGEGTAPDGAGSNQGTASSDTSMGGNQDSPDGSGGSDCSQNTSSEGSSLSTGHVPLGCPVTSDMSSRDNMQGSGGDDDDLRRPHKDEEKRKRKCSNFINLNASMKDKSKAMETSEESSGRSSEIMAEGHDLDVDALKSGSLIDGCSASQRHAMHVKGDESTSKLVRLSDSETCKSSSDSKRNLCSVVKHSLDNWPVLRGSGREQICTSNLDITQDASHGRASQEGQGSKIAKIKDCSVRLPYRNDKTTHRYVSADSIIQELNDQSFEVDDDDDLEDSEKAQKTDTSRIEGVDNAEVLAVRSADADKRISGRIRERHASGAVLPLVDVQKHTTSSPDQQPSSVVNSSAGVSATAAVMKSVKTMSKPEQSGGTKMSMKVIVSTQETTTDEESDYLMLDDFSYSETNDEDDCDGGKSLKKKDQSPGPQVDNSDILVPTDDQQQSTQRRRKHPEESSTAHEQQYDTMLSIKKKLISNKCQVSNSSQVPTEHLQRKETLQKQTADIEKVSAQTKPDTKCTETSSLKNITEVGDQHSEVVDNSEVGDQHSGVMDNSEVGDQHSEVMDNSEVGGSKGTEVVDPCTMAAKVSDQHSEVKAQSFRASERKNEHSVASEEADQHSEAKEKDKLSEATEMKAQHSRASEGKSRHSQATPSKENIYRPRGGGPEIKLKPCYVSLRREDTAEYHQNRFSLQCERSGPSQSTHLRLRIKTLSVQPYRTCLSTGKALSAVSSAEIHHHQDFVEDKQSNFSRDDISDGDLHNLETAEKSEIHDSINKHQNNELIDLQEDNRQRSNEGGNSEERFRMCESTEKIEVNLKNNRSLSHDMNSENPDGLSKRSGALKGRKDVKKVVTRSNSASEISSPVVKCLDCDAVTRSRRNSCSIHPKLCSNQRESSEIGEVLAEGCTSVNISNEESASETTIKLNLLKEKYSMSGHCRPHDAHEESETASKVDPKEYDLCDAVPKEKVDSQEDTRTKEISGDAEDVCNEFDESRIQQESQMGLHFLDTVEESENSGPVISYRSEIDDERKFTTEKENEDHQDIISGKVKRTEILEDCKDKETDNHTESSCKEFQPHPESECGPQDTGGLSSGDYCKALETGSEEDEKELIQIDRRVSALAHSAEEAKGGDRHTSNSVILSGEHRKRIESGSDDNLRERIVEKIKAESLARSSPGEEGPFKCPTCKRMYRTRESYEFHVRDCDFEVSTSDEEDKPIIKELRSNKRYAVESGERGRRSSSDVDKLKILSSSSPSPLHEPLSIIITDEFKDEKLSPSSRDFSDDCSSVQSQDSRRSSLRKSTVTQRNAAPLHLAKVRHRDSKLSTSPDGSTCSSLLSPRSSVSKAEDKPSPKETMLEAVGLISRKSLDLSPNSDLDGLGGSQTKTVRLQPRVSPTAIIITPKREKSPAISGPGGISRPSIMSGGVMKPGSSHLKSIAITYDPVIVEEIKLEPLKPKRPRQRRIWWVEESECPDDIHNNEENEEAGGEEEEDDEGNEEEGIAHRTRQRASSELKSPSIRKGGQSKREEKPDESNFARDEDEQNVDAETASRSCSNPPRQHSSLKKDIDTSTTPLFSKLRSGSRLSMIKNELKQETQSGKEAAKPETEPDKEIPTANKEEHEMKDSIIESNDASEPLETNLPETMPLLTDNVRSTRSRDRKVKDAESENKEDTSRRHQSDEPLVSPVRRSRRQPSKTTKLSEYLIELKKEKEANVTEEMKTSKQEVGAPLDSSNIESKPTEIALRRGRPRSRVNDEKDMADSAKRGRSPKQCQKSNVESDFDKDEGCKSDLIKNEHEKCAVRVHEFPMLNPETSGTSKLVLRSSDRIRDRSSGCAEREKSNTASQDQDEILQKATEDEDGEESFSPGDQTVHSDFKSKDACTLDKRSSGVRTRSSSVKQGQTDEAEEKQGAAQSGSQTCTSLNKDHENSSKPTVTEKQASDSENTHERGMDSSSEKSNDIARNGPNRGNNKASSSFASDIPGDLLKKDNDESNLGPPLPKQGPDKSKSTGQKLRIIIRSPNVLAAQTLGELIKKTTMSSIPEAVDITVTTKDSGTFHEREGAEKKCSLDTISSLGSEQKASESSLKEGASNLPSVDSTEETKSRDETPQMSRSVSPDSGSAAYDIQSDDFSSETSNDADDYGPTVPVSAGDSSQTTTSHSTTSASTPAPTRSISILSSSIGTCAQKSNTINQNLHDSDDDVVIVKAVGLQPPEPSMVQRSTQSAYPFIGHSQAKLSIPSVHSQQYPSTTSLKASSSSTISVSSCARTQPTQSILQQSGSLSQLHQQPLSTSPNRQNVHPYINLRHQNSPPQPQQSIMISEVSPGRFILQQQPNPRQDFLASCDISQSGLLLRGTGQPGIIIQTPNQPGLALQNTTPSSILFRSANPAGLMLSPSNPAALLQGQPPILQGSGQSGLSFISLNPPNPLASTIISPLQSLQSHVSPPSLLPPSMGLTPLMQAAALSNQPLMISQPFMSQPSMFLPQLNTQPLLQQQVEDHRQQAQHHIPQQQNPQQQQANSSTKPSSSVIIDPHAHMLASGLNQTILKTSQQQFSPLKQRSTNSTNNFGQEPAPSHLPISPFPNIQSQATSSPALFSPPVVSSSVSAALPQRTYSPSPSMAPVINLQKTNLSVPKLTKVDGAPTQVNYMGSFDLNTSTLQSVMSGQSFSQEASKRIMELVQSALKSQGKDHIPGVEVTSAITNTPQGPKKILRVLINEDILPGSRSHSAQAQPMSSAQTAFGLPTSSSSLSDLTTGQDRSTIGLDSDWTKLLPSSSRTQQQQQPVQNLWSPSNTGYVSIPINQNLSTSSRTSTQPNVSSSSSSSTHFRRALKPSAYPHLTKRKMTSSPVSAGCEASQPKRPIIEKTMNSDGSCTGTLQQIVEKPMYASDFINTSMAAQFSSGSASSLMSKIVESSYSINSMLPGSHTASSVYRTNQEPAEVALAGGDISNLPTTVLEEAAASAFTSTEQSHSQFTQLQQHPYHSATKEQHKLQQSPHKRASFPLISPAKKPQAAVALSQAIKGRARKQVLQKSRLKKDPHSQTHDKETRHKLAGKRKGAMGPRKAKTVVASHHPLIHHKKGVDSLPQPTLEEEVVATPLDLGRGDHSHGPGARGERERSQSRLRFEISSDDGFCCHGDTVEDAWKQVVEKVQDVRAASRMKQLSYAGISGRTMFGLDHDAVVYLIEQLYGAVHCHRNYKFRFHKYDLDQADEEVALNPSGAARSETFSIRKPFDMFNFLKSVYRTKPGDDEREKEEEMALKSSRRATSLSLPMAMRFRKLKTFAKEAVDVYRSKIHGRGLFCKRNIDAGEMVIEYAGEVIRASLTDKREKYYESKGIGCYMFRIDDDEVVDATMHGSAARFINHSCEPNCFSKVILVDGKKHIVIFAMRPIKRGEELTYDYKFPIEEVKIPCSCGSKRCRKYLN